MTMTTMQLWHCYDREDIHDIFAEARFPVWIHIGNMRAWILNLWWGRFAVIFKGFDVRYVWLGRSLLYG